MKMINKCKKAAILATVLGGISIGASVNAATIVVGGASDYSTGTEIATINGSWVTSYVNTGSPTTDPFQASGWFDVTKYQQLRDEGNDAKLVAYIRSNDPQYKYMTDAEFEAAGAEAKILGYYKNLNLHNIPDELKPGLYSNDVSIHRIVLNGKTYAYLRQTSGTGSIKMPGVAIDLQGWESMGSNQIKGETDSVNAHDAVAKGAYIYLADYTGCQIGVGKVSSDGKSILNESKKTINIKEDLATNGKVAFDENATYYLHGEGMVIDGNDLYVLVNVNTSSAWSGYAPSYLIKYNIQNDGSLKYVDHTTMGKNTDMVKPEKFNNHVFATAIGGYQFNGMVNEETSLDYAEIKEDGTFGINGKINLPDNVKNKESEFRGMRILPNGTVYVMRYYLAVTDDHTNMTLYKTTVSNLLAENPVDWEVIENANNVKGWFDGVDAEYYTKRVWLRKGNELILYVDGKEVTRWNASEFSHSGTFTTMQAFDVMTPEGISGKLAELNALADKVINNDNAVWNENATVATVTGENTISGNAAITADASMVDLGNNISAAVYAKDNNISITADNLQLQSENTVATPVGIYAGNGKAVNIKAENLNVITKGYENGNNLTNAIWLDPSAEGTQAKITIEAPVNIAMTGGFGGNGIAIQKTDRWGESSTEAEQKAEVNIKGDVSIKGADNQTWGIGVNSENVFSRFNNAGILAAVNNSSVTVDGNVYMDVYGNGIATTAQGSSVTVKGGEITVPTGMGYGYYTLASYLGTINMNTGADGATAGSDTVKLDGDIFALKDTGNINLALTTAESYLNGAIDNGGNVKLYLQNGAIWNNEANNTRYSLDSEDTGSLFGSDRASHVNTFVGADTIENAGAIYQGLNSENIKIDNYSGNSVVLYERDAEDNITGGTVTIGNAEAGSTIVARTNYSESLEADASKVDQVLSDMAGKLFYTAATEGKTDLQGKVEIAEGLLTGAVAEYYSDITFDGANQGKGTIGEVMEVEKHRQEFTGNIAGGITDADPVYGAYVNANGEIDFSNVKTKDENGNDVTAGVIALKGSAGAIIGATDNAKPVTIEMGGNDLVLGAADGASEAVQGIVANTSKVEIKDAGKLTIQANGDGSAIHASGAGAAVKIETANEFKTVRLEANGVSDKAVLHAEDGATVEIGGKVNITKTSGNDAIMVGKGAQVVLKGGVIGNADDDGVAIRIVEGGKVTINQDGTQKVVTNGDIVFGTKPVEPDQPGGGEEPGGESGGETKTPGVYEGANAYIQGGDSNIGDADRYGNCGTFEADSQNVKVDFTYLNRDENNNVLPEEDWVQKVVINGNSELIKSNATNATVTKHATISMAGKDLEATATNSEDGKAAYAIYAVTEGTEGTSNVTIRDAGNIKIVAQNDANGGASAIYADGGEGGSAKVAITTRESNKTVTLKANATGNDKAVLHAVNNAEVTIDGIIDITETDGDAVMVGKGSSVTLNGGVIGAADDEEAISLAEGNDVAIRLVDGGKLSINQVPANEYDVAINGDIVLAGASNAIAEASKISFNTKDSYYNGDIVNNSSNLQNLTIDFSDGADWTGNASGVNLDVTLNGKDTIWTGTYDAKDITDTGLTLRLERSAQWDNSGSQAEDVANIKSFTTTRRGEVVNGQWDENTQGFVHMGAGALNIANYSGDATFIYQNTDGVVAEDGNVTIKNASDGSLVTMRTGYNSKFEDKTIREQAFDDLAGKLTYTAYAQGEDHINGKVEITEGLLTGAKTKYVEDITFNDTTGVGYIDWIPANVALYEAQYGIKADGDYAVFENCYTFDEWIDENTGSDDLTLDFSNLDASKDTVIVNTLAEGIKSEATSSKANRTKKVTIELDGKNFELNAESSDPYASGIYAVYSRATKAHFTESNVTINNAGNISLIAKGEGKSAYAIYADHTKDGCTAKVTINTVDGDKLVTLKTIGKESDKIAAIYAKQRANIEIDGIVDITETSGNKAIWVGKASEVNINGGKIGDTDGEVAIYLKDGGAININENKKDYDVITNGDIVLDGDTNGEAGGGQIIYNTATSAHNGNIVSSSANAQSFAVEFNNGAKWNGYVDGVGLDLTLSDGAIWKVQDREEISTNSLKSMSGNGGYVEMGIDNVSVGTYSGDTTFIYKNNNGMVAGGGNVTITKAAENSNVTMYTSYNANFENETTRNQALAALAQKLYYTNHQEGNLTATAVIGEGLLTDAYSEKYTSGIEFTVEDGQGTAVGNANKAMMMMSTFAMRRSAPASEAVGASEEATAVVRDITYSTKDSAHNADIINYTNEKQDFAVAFTNGADWNGSASGVNLDVLLEGADTVWTGSYDEGTIAGTGLTVEINDGATWKVQDKPASKAKAAGTTNVKTMKGNGGFVEMGTDNMNIGTYSGSTTFIYENQDGNITGGNVTIDDAAENSAVTMRTNYHESFEDETARNTAMDALAGKLFYNNADDKLSGIAVISEGLMTGEKAKYYSDITFDAANDGKGTVGEVVVVPDQSGSGSDDDGGFQTTETTAVRISKSAMASSVMMWRNESDDVMQRMGDLRLGTEENGIWAKYYNGDASYNEAGTIYNSNYKAYQVGYDKKLANGWTVGAALSYNDAEHKYEMGTKGEGTAVGVTAYGAWNNDKGHFANVAIKGSQLDNEFDVTNATRDLTASGDYSTWGLSVSAEYGRRMEQSNGFYFEPSAKLTIGRVQDAEYTVTTDDGQQMFVEQGGFNSIVGELGVGMGKRFERGTVFTKFALAHEFAGDFSANFMDSNSRSVKSDADFGGSWYEWQLGGSVKVNDNSYVYATYEKTFGGDAARDWRVDAGVRWTF